MISTCRLTSSRAIDVGPCHSECGPQTGEHPQHHQEAPEKGRIGTQKIPLSPQHPGHVTPGVSGWKVCRWTRQAGLGTVWRAELRQVRDRTVLVEVVPWQLRAPLGSAQIPFLCPVLSPGARYLTALSHSFLICTMGMQNGLPPRVARMQRGRPDVWLRQRLRSALFSLLFGRIFECVQWSTDG